MHQHSWTSSKIFLVNMQISTLSLLHGLFPQHSSRTGTIGFTATTRRFSTITCNMVRLLKFTSQTVWSLNSLALRNTTISSMKAKYLLPHKISMVSVELCSIKMESIVEMLMCMKAGSLTVCLKDMEESSIRMVPSMSALSDLV